MSCPDCLPFLTVDDVATLIHSTKAGVYKLVERRRLPAVRVGTKLLFDREILLRYLRTSCLVAGKVAGDD